VNVSRSTSKNFHAVSLAGVCALNMTIVRDLFKLTVVSYQLQSYAA